MEVSAYADYLTEADLRLIARAVGASAAAVAELAGDAAAIEGLLADPRVFSAVFETVSPGSPASHAAPEVLVFASPFLAFGVAVHRAVADLAAMDYLPERSGPRQRVPVFDTPELRDFLGSAERRLFLAELLASFTRVASGRYRVPSRWGGSGPGPGSGSGGRSRTRRFSELDPVKLAGLIEVAPEESRPGIYRRLGDVSLFLAGVFPDYSAMHAFGPVDVSRLLRSARVPAGDRDGLAVAPALDLLEYLGARWYRAALATAPVRTARLDVVGEVAERFRQARRVLNHLADRYLVGSGSSGTGSGGWLPQPGTP
ncbi:MAG TPA: hypothetical protein VH136_17620 [Trebonia sp.]|jgi:hypothetical protein|nr:hypothetical protein [Trebonia sp.]